nr:oligopeptide:H+ symporter [Pseudoclavibacter alba]
MRRRFHDRRRPVKGTTVTTPKAPSSPSERDAAILSDRRFVGHPIGLAFLFNTELWERFSYYGMRAILLYFIVDTIANGGLGLDQSLGEAIVTTYGASVYLLTVIGGWAADRVLGARRATLYGGVVIMAGHIFLALPLQQTAWLGLILVAFGTGFLKPNVSTLVSHLYSMKDARRDSAFAIFYMSVNIGSLLAPFVVSALRMVGGYHLGFLAAAVGMCLALITLVLGRKQLTSTVDDISNPLSPDDLKKLPIKLLGIVIACVAVFFIAAMLRGALSEGFTQEIILGGVVDAISLVSIALSIGYFVLMFRSKKVTASERSHLMAYVPLWIGATLFFMIFEQAAAKMATYADSRTNLDTGLFVINPELYQSVNPAGIVLLSPLMAVLWVKLAGKFPSTAQKFSIGVLLAGLSFVLLAITSDMFPGATSPWWILAVAFLIQTVGELCLSPVGLSATTRMAPRAFASQAMALWFLTSAVGQSLAAQFISGLEDQPDTVFYWILGGMTTVFAIALFAMSPWIRRHMADVELTDAIPTIENAEKKA